ncbi:MAG: AgmX/PglI C-terminal domain-containing protein [Bdellovibrionaceae bacterium]|nr:AgmX/PglI C-terminal domain-containing protein [Bdellovibrio sp.]
MFYLKDIDGQVVRAIDWSDDQITAILREDTLRVELTEDLSYYDDLKIKYTILDVIKKSDLDKNKSHQIKQLKGHLTLVSEDGEILENVALPVDDQKQFAMIAKRTAQVAAGIAVVLFGLTFLVKPQTKPELEVVQVMDRQQIEKIVAVPVSPVKPVARVSPKYAQKVKTVKVKQAQAVVKPSGVLGVLGSLKNSKQRGGLKLNDAQASAGIGRGGTEGSGGVQTSVYAKGMFSAPVGTGGKVNGAGGYGTRGKGGGQAGYGKISLVGSGGAFFTPVESEALVGGGLDRNEIPAVINRHLSEVRFCYEQGLQQKPKLAGRLSMNFMIGPNGAVASAKVMNSSLNHAVVEGCIRDRLKTWNFPKPVGGVTVKVSYPFILKRVSDS